MYSLVATDIGLLGTLKPTIDSIFKRCNNYSITFPEGDHVSYVHLRISNSGDCRVTVTYVPNNTGRNKAFPPPSAMISGDTAASNDLEYEFKNNKQGLQKVFTTHYNGTLDVILKPDGLGLYYIDVL